MLPFKNKDLLYPIVNIEAAGVSFVSYVPWKYFVTQQLVSWVLFLLLTIVVLAWPCLQGPNSLDPMHLYYVIFHYFDSRSTQGFFYNNYIDILSKAVTVSVK